MRKYLALLTAMVVVSVAVLAGSALAGKGGTDRPFKGVGTGTTTTALPPGPWDGVTVNSTSAGTFNGSHLGNGTYSIVATQDWTGYPVATNSGTFQFVAANGDVLNGSVGGTTTEQAPFDNTTYQSALDVTIAGGTGRFVGASGSIAISGDSTGPAFGPFADTFTWTGKISY